MTESIGVDIIQVFSIVFSLATFFFIFSLVKNKRIKEEYSILWFVMSLVFFYLSVDRLAIDRLGALFGIDYKPSILFLLTTGFIFLVLIHITVVITRLSEESKELIQELGLHGFDTPTPGVDHPPVLIIVPAYNEEKSIVKVIDDLRSIELELDILIINDGSSDKTSQVARNTCQALVLDLPKNLGIGGAVQTGFKYASRNDYQYAIQFDGDGQHMASEIPKLLAAMEENCCNMVIGSRFLEKHNGFRSTFVRRLGIRLFMIINSILIGQKITDNTSGFRAYDRSAIDFLSRYYPVDYPEPEVVILLGKNGLRICEVTTLMQERQGGDSSITGIWGSYYMVKVVLAILMTALRRPLR
jgi:hypothetical protein